MQTTAAATSPTLADGASFARYECGSASIAHAAWPVRRCPGTIEVVAVRGLVTASAWAGMARATGQLERRDASIAAVSMMDCAVVALSAEQMCAADMELVRAGLLRNPRAFVVSPSSVELFRRYAWLMAWQGIGRDVFTGAEMPQALRWAQEKGLVLLADRQRGRRRAA